MTNLHVSACKSGYTLINKLLALYLSFPVLLNLSVGSPMNDIGCYLEMAIMTVTRISLIRLKFLYQP